MPSESLADEFEALVNAWDEALREEDDAALPNAADEILNNALQNRERIARALRMLEKIEDPHHNHSMWDAVSEAIADGIIAEYSPTGIALDVFLALREAVK